MKLEDIGEIALREYKSVKYFPFKNQAGAPFSLTSDPLGYLEAFIDSWHNSIKRDKYKVKNKLVKARYFTQLSRDFYNSSLQAKMPSKGTLLYYSFINLVKVYLLIEGYDLETKIEHHGLSLPATSTNKLKLANPNGGGISIFHEFAKVLGKEIKNGDGLDLNFIDLVWELPEVHEIGYALDLFTKKRKFLPVEIKIRTNKKRNRLFYTVSYEKKFDKQMKVDKLTKGICKQKLIELDIENDPKRKHFRSKYSTAYTKGSNRSWVMCYKKIIQDINTLNITPMLTRQGYRYYLDLEPYRLHRLSSFLGFAYYIGTIARYRPTLNEKILKGKFQPLINEAIISCPNQFFYLMTSHITKQICAIPMAKIE
ncbi:YaaC family protein [Tenacibaculum aquimarinum]|uniref:YaaC family protein n=1 Tax=Tenacibaculum aquimarinum TaxID=2910675 RepID=UPI001F0A44CD|nr:YaaC family protein [Tenacibaculum aquimarinum]MCH3882083.1 YaaC family protein [Tenacibaculum aquimarinum]